MSSGANLRVDDFQVSHGKSAHTPCLPAGTSLADAETAMSHRVNEHIRNRFPRSEYHRVTPPAPHQRDKLQCLFAANPTNLGPQRIHVVLCKLRANVDARLHSCKLCVPTGLIMIVQLRP